MKLSLSSTLLVTALGAALSFTAPAAAQNSYGFATPGVSKSSSDVVLVGGKLHGSKSHFGKKHKAKVFRSRSGRFNRSFGTRFSRSKSDFTSRNRVPFGSSSLRRSNRLARVKRDNFTGFLLKF